MADTAKQIDFLLAGYRHPTTDVELAGGKVKTFLDGTSTLSALWTDKDKGAAAANPVVLDSAGKAEVFGDNIYKFEIYDSDDVLIETLNGLEYSISHDRYFNRARFTYNGGSTAYTVRVRPGNYYCKDKYCQWTSELTTPAIGTPAADTPYYLYLDYSAITSGTAITSTELVWSDTAPTWSNTYRQLLNGDDRCIFGVISNSGPTNILEFFHDGGERTFYADYILDRTGASLSDTFTDVTITVPAFVEVALLTFDSHYSNADVYLVCITKDQVGTSGRIVGYSAAGSTYSWNSTPVFLGTDLKIQVKHSAATTNLCSVLTDGWCFPIGM